MGAEESKVMSHETEKCSWASKLIKEKKWNELQIDPNYKNKEKEKAIKQITKWNKMNDQIKMYQSLEKREWNKLCL